MAAINWATYFTGLPLDEDGWTILMPSPDSRLIYVSNDGNDSTGQIYNPNDAVIGPDPQNPTGPINAFSTLSAARGNTRNNMPDWVMMKRGDIWNENFGLLRNGRSKTERFVITYWGSATDPMPIINGLNQPGPALRGSEYQKKSSNHAVVGINLTFGTYSSIGSTNNMLIEDCIFLHGGISQSSEGYDEPDWGTEFVIRRSVVYGNYSTGTAHSQGIFISSVKNVLIEDTFTDHNGWWDWRTDTRYDEWSVEGNYSVGDFVKYNNRLYQATDFPVSEPGTSGSGWTRRGQPTRFNHNMYLNTGNRGFVVINNITARGSSMNIQQRPGGIQQHNLSVDGNVGLYLGYHASSHSHRYPLYGYQHQNVVIGVAPPDGLQQAGWGLTSHNTSNHVAADNIIQNSRHGGPALSHFMENNFPGNKLIDNIIYNFSAITTNANTDVVSGNIVIREGGGSIFTNQSANSIESVNNFAFSPTNPSLRPGWTAITLEQVVSLFSDPGRDIFRYCNEVLGQSFTDIDEAQLWYFEQLRNMHRGNWDERFRAEAVINWIRAGFDKSAIQPLNLRMVPEVAGLTQAEATALLEAEDLVVAVVEVEDPAVKEGNVISADIAAYRFIPEGSTVTLTVSGEGSGSDFAPIPDVVGQERNAAIAALLEAGFEVSLVWSAINEAPVDQVISQNPIAGTEWLKTESGGSPVTITVSLGTGGGFVPTSGRGRASLEENFIR